MSKEPRRFLALLRGINVGGKNIIPKDNLRECFEDLGCVNVRTYIQSGNILFRSDVRRVDDLTRMVKAGLSQRFAYDAQAVVIPERKYRSMVNAAPEHWGLNEDQKHNALFTLAGTSSARVLEALNRPLRSGFEAVTVAPGVLFWSVSKQKFGMSTIATLAALPIYQRLTVRNHNTVLRLLELFDQI